MAKVNFILPEVKLQVALAINSISLTKHCIVMGCLVIRRCGQLNCFADPLRSCNVGTIDNGVSCLVSSMCKDRPLSHKVGVCLPASQFSPRPAGEVRQNV